jgi:hypothetical protein
VLPLKRAFLPCTEDERMENSRAPGSYISKLHMSQIASHPSAAGAVQRMGVRLGGQPQRAHRPPPQLHQISHQKMQTGGCLQSDQSGRRGICATALLRLLRESMLEGAQMRLRVSPEFPLNCNARANTHTISRKLTTFKF